MGRRDENRERIEAAILELGRRQLAEVGPAQLSLRAVARELGVSSSAVYRYVESRDDLLTRLIVGAYEDVGRAVEAAVAELGEGGGEGLTAWRTACHALRGWARAHPNEWTLVYGSPVPGYVAPESTVAPAGLVARVLARIVRAGGPVDDLRASFSADLVGQLDQTAEMMDLPADPARTALLVFAWSQLVGTIGLELSGHYVGSVDPTDDYWQWLVDDLAERLGLCGTR